jgi:hypothetical protein
MQLFSWNIPGLGGTEIHLAVIFPQISQIPLMVFIPKLHHYTLTPIPPSFIVH